MLELPYYPRPALLNKIRTAYESGLAAAICLFAPRREGKTWFVRRELIPALEKDDWCAIYIDLWDNREVPELAIVNSLEAKSPPPRAVLRRIKKLEVKVAGSGGSLEQFQDPADAEVSLQGRLKAALNRLAKKNAPVILIIDEVQTLASSRDANFVAALRASLQAHQGTVFAFFTGSSRNALNRMFRDRKAPLFDSAYPMSLDDLGRGFIEDRASVYKRLTGKDTNPDALEEVFDAVGKNPFYMNQIILKMIVDEINDPRQAHEQWELRDDDDGFKARWVKLKALHQAILAELAHQSDEGIYTEPARKRIAKRMGMSEPLKASVIQQGIRNLTKNGLVDSIGEPGRYELADRAFAHFIESGNG
jgi:hypothetical protein